MSKHKFDLVRFDDKLIYHGSYNLSPRAIKVMCFVIAKYVNPEEDARLPTELYVPLTEIAEAITDGNKKPYKSIYQEIDGICDELTSKIKFNSTVKVEGISMKGYINWCSSAIPIKDKDNRVYVRFGFDPLMAQFLLGLSRYVRLYRPELNRLRKGYAIRLFQMLKGIRNRRGPYEQISVERYEVERLKFLFGLANKYEQFKYFNNQVIKPSVKEINDKTTIEVVKMKLIRNSSRSVQAIEFYFRDQVPKVPLPPLPKETIFEDYEPGSTELRDLTMAKHTAYTQLVEFGIKPGIAFKQIIPAIKGSLFQGYEDYFIKFAIEHFMEATHFKKSSPQAKAGAFVKWWVENKVYDLESPTWSQIVEKVRIVQKNYEKNDPEKLSNRERAKSMTEAEFKTWYKKERQYTVFD